ARLGVALPPAPLPGWVRDPLPRPEPPGNAGFQPRRHTPRRLPVRGPWHSPLPRWPPRLGHGQPAPVALRGDANGQTEPDRGQPGRQPAGRSLDARPPPALRTDPGLSYRR